MNLVPRADRLQLRLPITYRAQGDEEWLLSRVVNLSESGVLFGPTGLSPGTVVEVIISPPIQVGARAPGPHVCAGTVVRTTEMGDVADVVREGLQISLSRYDEARQYIAACKDGLARFYKTAPVVVVPAATGPAPFGLASTGDARMNAPWTALGTPAISIPMPVQDGLPLGLQLTADRGEDARVIRPAVRLQRILEGGSLETSQAHDKGASAP